MTNSYKKSSTPSVVRIPNPKDNFGLSKKEFEDFVVKVRNGDESLFIRVFNIHFKASIRYVQNKFGISEETAYDVCMDTMLVFRNKLKNGKIKYGNIRYLYTKMAVHRYLDLLKRKSKIDEAIEVFMGSNYDQKIDQEDFLSLLNNALDNLDNPQKHMIKEIFYSGKPTDQIIAENDITYSTFRKRKQRSLAKLKSSFLDLLNRSK